MSEITGWIRSHEALLQLTGLLSLGLAIVTLAAMIGTVVLLPADYFQRAHKSTERQAGGNPVYRVIAVFLRNVVGIILVAAGILMLFLPGQGVVTILLGLALTSFPGKHAIERRIVNRKEVGRTLNRIRNWAGKEPFDFSA